MKKDLNISLVQLDIVWEDAKTNCEKIEALLTQVKNSDLIILPEMFSTGFTMNSEKFAEEMTGPTVRWMKEVAASTGAALCGSLIIKDKNYYNRCLFVMPNGEVEYYDKRHLFRMAGETEYFSQGKNRKIVQYLGWKIDLQVCYDLRFPVFSRNIFKDGSWEYDLLIYIANWPGPRSNAWRSLVEARAHENQCYVAAVNRVGTDGSGLDYLGDSSLISAKGEHLISLEQHEENVASAIISMEELIAFRKKFPIGLDADNFSIQN